MKRRIAILLLVSLLLSSIPAVPAGALWVMPKGPRAVKLALLPSRVTIKVDVSKRLVPSTQPRGAAVDLEWTVKEGDGCLDVDQYGNVTGRKPGTAVVQARDRLSGLAALRRVTVRPVVAKSLRLNRYTMMLNVGESFESLAVSFNPVNTTDKTVAWSATNPGVVNVTVDEATGMAKVTGERVGITTVVARSNGKRVGCKVQVVNARKIFTISAVGDVLLGGDPRPEKVAQNALKRNSYEAFHTLAAEKGEDYFFANVRDELLKDDVTVANLECVLTNRLANLPKRNKSHVLVGHADRGTRILREAGVEMVSLGNNHTMDLGRAGFDDTRGALKKSGIVYGDQTYNGNGIYLVKRDGFTLKVGLLGYQTPLSGGSSMSSIKRRITQMKRAGCNVVIAYFHWCDTKEWTARNYPKNRAVARAAINAGADLVLGAHRHVPAGIECYKNRYIVHDLSNFVVGIKHKADKESGRSLTDSMIFQWKVSVDKKGVVCDEGISVIPCTTTTSEETYPATDSFGDKGAKVNNWQPAILTGGAGREVIARIQAMSNVDIPMGPVG